MDLCCAVERRCPHTPGHHNVASIIGDSGFKMWINRSHEVDNTATHTEPDDPHPVPINAMMVLQERHGSIDVLNNVRILQPRPTRLGNICSSMTQ